MSEKAIAIQYGGMGMARKMLTVLADIDRALAVNEDEGLTLIRKNVVRIIQRWCSKIETKGGKFSPTKIEQLLHYPPSEDFPANTVIDELESGYMYKDRVLIPARVVVASEQ